ncbi:sugar phosphate isomerase/epimerase family protein [Flavobacterium chungbukense]|uniref:Sugar phosphate isomerase/epimerase n=1 Tax=Flavobacterium chungbukense TaxID=877464 RepID=A0ABP7Y7E0_9FLAO|nr:sugar phosphate isomerase/epimerase [Flavobacterium chungbukense]MCC4923839.1 sugar phosphate isomerase/epimerase [Flavobacterium chungbukense]
MIKRRDFLITSGLALGAVAIAPSLAFSAKPKNIGLQLYTLRDEFSKNVKGVLEHVAKTGYKEIETYGYSSEKGFFGTSPKDFKKIMNDNGLKAPSGHYDFNSFIKDSNTDFLKASIECAKQLESEYITVPYLDEKLRSDLDGFKRIAQKINEAAVLCKQSGLKLAYHNHDFEFKKFGDKTGYDILLQETDKKLVDFELDLYWAVRSGNDPLALFKVHPGRFTMWHVKDMDKSKAEWNTEIGEGSINFKTIFAEAKLSGMKHFFVEQETNYSPNPTESIKTSWDFVSKQLI